MMINKKDTDLLRDIVLFLVGILAGIELCSYVLTGVL